jgi:hypothetical protein
VLIAKTVLLGLTVFLIGAVIYMLVAPRLLRARGIGNISPNSVFLWIAFVERTTFGHLETRPIVAGDTRIHSTRGLHGAQ